MSAAMQYPPHALVFDLDFLRSNNPDDVPKAFKRMVKDVLTVGFIVGNPADVDDFFDLEEFGEAWDDVFDDMGGLRYCKSGIEGLPAKYDHGWTRSNVVCVAGDGEKRWCETNGLRVFDSLQDLIDWVYLPEVSIKWSEQEAPLTPTGVLRPLNNWSDVLGLAPQVDGGYWGATNSICLLDNHLFTENDVVRILKGQKSNALDNLVQLCVGLTTRFNSQHLLLCVGIHLYDVGKLKEIGKLIGASRMDRRSKALNEIGVQNLQRSIQFKLQEAGCSMELELVGMLDKSHKLHDRTVLMNHHTLFSGPGYNLFGWPKVKEGRFQAGHVFMDSGKHPLPAQLFIHQWTEVMMTIRAILTSGNCTFANHKGEIVGMEGLRHPFVPVHHNRKA